ncbi:MAG: LysR family transcriptional regulator, partial [Rhodocyclaceae bacterium]|nr:LysR family transcriptional regulator [Rhodocyclaceae bacterium]
MELRQLRYFSAIAKHGSFSKAAEQVFVAQSALSHQLAQLESELGARLFHRSRRGVVLTEAGRVFLAHATAILRQVEDARASVMNVAGEPSGKVVFGVPHSASNALALPLLQAVREQLPKVELELTEELTGNLVPQLRSGQINLAVLF